MLEQKTKIILLIVISIGVFAYFKYSKKNLLESKYAIAIGGVAVATGCFFAGMKYSINTLIDILLLNSNVPYMLEKLFWLGYVFILVGIMTLFDESLNKVSKDNQA